MIKKIGLGYVAISLWSSTAIGAVDVYGVDQTTAAKIVKKYSKNIEIGLKT